MQKHLNIFEIMWRK